MLHINKVSASHHAKPHPYMRKIYQNLDSLEVQDLGKSDGTLVQGFRRPELDGWIWFNITSLSPFMMGAELVLFRKALHPRPLSVSVTLHSVIASQGRLDERPVLEERQLALDQRPPSGYDVFDVSAVLAAKPVEAVGFQLRYTDESGSLVLHEALTQSLYCLHRGSLSEPLLVLYQSHPLSLLSLTQSHRSTTTLSWELWNISEFKLCSSKILGSLSMQAEPKYHVLSCFWICKPV
uniref:TGF-beta propeptide domain-containing protein n=2 Tax=Oreochromis TaxID=8139 RepID=A0A669BRT9_ORENI